MDMALRRQSKLEHGEIKSSLRIWIKFEVCHSNGNGAWYESSRACTSLQHAVQAVDGKILFTFTDKDDAEAKMAVAASKEPLLFRKAVHKIIHDARVDVAAVCIDPKCN